MRRIILLTGLVLAGCVFGNQPTTDWQRSGTTPQQAGDDYAACHRASQKRVDLDLQADQDMGADPTSQGSLATNLAQYGSDKKINAMTHDCMVALDYYPAGKTTP